MLKRVINKIYSSSPMIISTFFLIGCYCQVFASRLPDTLRFGDTVYAKHLERLYHNEAKFIIINESGDHDYVMASLFRDHVAFFNPQGDIIKTDSLPAEPRFNYSKTGRWLFLWGDYDELNNYYRLYNQYGEVLFDTVSPPRSYESRFGMPLEKSLRFLRPGSPEVTLTMLDRNGNPLAGVSPLGYGAKKRYFYVSDANDEHVYLTVSADTATVFIRYNIDLVEQYRTIIPFKEVGSLRTSAKGGYVLIRVADVRRGHPMIITDQSGEPLFEIPYPQIVKISRDESLLAYTTSMGAFEVVDIVTGKTIIKPRVSPETEWSDINFSGDGKRLVAFDGYKIVLVNLETVSWFVAPFPFAFFQATLINGSDNLVFTGDFGWVVYQKIK